MVQAARPIAALFGTVAILVACVHLRAQQPVARNPFEGDAQALRSGMSSFRGSCAYCHGMDARGATKGPDLTGLWASGATDQGIFTIVKRGVPGTAMPVAGVTLTDNDVWKTLAYLKTLAVTAPPAALPGDAGNGARLFAARCSGCHRVDGAGGVLGPDLSRIGAGRSRVVLESKIRGIAESVTEGYEPVTLITSDGATIQAVRKNRDRFSIQVMDSRERLQGYPADKLEKVVDEKRSLMPAFDKTELNDRALEDLLHYLGSLRGTAPAAR